jgi:hypothetical protein
MDHEPSSFPNIGSRDHPHLHLRGELRQRLDRHGGQGSGASSGAGAGTPGTIDFSISGEVLALGGYGFPPTDMNAAFFVDGWEIKFSELLVTVDKIKISSNPDLNPGDQSQTGPLVAEVDGPWAVDLHLGGPLPGKGGTGEEAVKIASLANQNKNGNAAFDPTVRYAFGFDVIAATSAAMNVNLTTQGQADYTMMQENGYTVLYVGTATFKGSSCMTTNSAYSFSTWPTVVNFKLGFKSPTTYINCQNPDNDPAKPLSMNEEHERGIFIKDNTATIGQLTIHTDHPFWESFVHDSPAHFDMLAAQHVGETGTPTVVLEDVKGVDPTAITDKAMMAAPWRWCSTFYTPPNMNKQMGFDPLTVPVNPMGNPSNSIRDLYDYMTYNQSTQGHLNSDGLCYVKRNYPSPP